MWWFLIHFLWSFVLDSKIHWLRWSWNEIGLTCWFWALKFVTLISSFFKVKQVLSNPRPLCMSDEMTNKFDWSVNQENVQTCAGYCSTNPLLKYLLRWIGNKNYVAEDWNGLSLILTRNGICQKILRLQFWSKKITSKKAYFAIFANLQESLLLLNFYLLKETLWWHPQFVVDCLSELFYTNNSAICTCVAYEYLKNDFIF